MEKEIVRDGLFHLNPIFYLDAFWPFGGGFCFFRGGACFPPGASAPPFPKMDANILEERRVTRLRTGINIIINTSPVPSKKIPKRGRVACSLFVYLMRCIMCITGLDADGHIYHLSWWVAKPLHTNIHYVIIYIRIDTLTVIECNQSCNHVPRI